MRNFTAVFLLTLMVSGFSFAQSTTNQASLDSLKQAILNLDQQIYTVQLHLDQSKKQLKTGMLVATIGYSVTILGGQLLGSNPQAGKGLLYLGGATGIAGTIVLVRGFNKLSIRQPERIDPLPSR